MARAGAIPYFGDAYMADTRHLSLEEHGAYHLLILIAWRSPNCALPDDDKRIAQMLGISAKKWASLRPTVMAFWTLTEHGWQQKRLTKERRWVEEKSRKNKDAADARWSDKPLKNNDPAYANEYPNAPASGHANGYAPPPPPKRRTPDKESGVAAQRANRLPADFQIPGQWIDWAMDERDWSLSAAQTEAAAFVDYWHAKGGRDATKLDWFATWRNWVRNSRRVTSERAQPVVPL